MEKRGLVYYRNYFSDFYFSQNQQVQAKIAWTLEVIRGMDKIPKQYLKYISGTDGLYQIRVQTGGNTFRIFCFFDKSRIIICHGFQKKTEKNSAK